MDKLEVKLNAHETARKDLFALRDAGLLVQRKRGREYEFAAMPDLAQLLQR